MRIGFGYDSHVFDESKELVLCGVRIPDCPGLKAHSDGDVVLHAVIDSLFGAAACGDIGSHFPDNDERWHNADSMELLREAVKEISKMGYVVGNVDVTVICERPRLRPFVQSMRQNLSAALNVDVSSVSVKGKTNEKMDDVGAGRGIVVHGVALLLSSSERNI